MASRSPGTVSATIVSVALYTGGIDTGYVRVTAKDRTITGLNCDDNGMWFLKARVTGEEWTTTARMVARLCPQRFRQYPKAHQFVGESFGALDIVLSTGEHALIAPIEDLCRSLPADVRRRYQPLWALSTHLFGLHGKYGSGSPTDRRLRAVEKDHALWRQYERDCTRVYGLALSDIRSRRRSR